MFISFIVIYILLFARLAKTQFTSQQISLGPTNPTVAAGNIKTVVYNSETLVSLGKGDTNGGLHRVALI